MKGFKWIGLGLLTIWLLAGCGQADQQEAQAMDTPDAEQQEQLARIYVTADRFYNHVQGARLDQARSEVNALAEQAVHLRFEHVTTLEGLEAFVQAVLDGKEQLQAVRYDEKEALLAAASVRLAADALMNRKQPLWLQFHKRMSADVEKLQQSVVAEDKDAVVKASTAVQDNYRLLRPSLMISKEPWEVQRLHSLVAFIQNEVTMNGTLSQTEVLADLRQTMDELFQSRSSSAYLPLETTPSREPILWSSIIGGIIALVLGYVAWRKYRYEKKGGPPSAQQSQS